MPDYRRSMCSAAFFFAGPGLLYGLFVSRLPALRERTGADDADLGLTLLILGLASLAALLLSPSIIGRLGSHRLLAPLVLLMTAGLLALGWSSSVPALMAAGAAMGFCIALTDVAINTQGINIERIFSSKSMSVLHACYNLGGIGGALLAALGAYLALSPLLNFAAVMAVYCAAACPVSRGLIPDQAAAAEAGAGAEHPQRRGCLSMPALIYLCGLLSMGGYMAEGSVGEWGTLLLHEYKGATEEVAALVYGAFSVTCVLSRLAADWVRARVREDVMAAGCSAAAASLTAAVCLESPLAALACYALLGLCLGPVVPILFSLAGTARGVSAAQASSFVGTMAYSGLLLFPPSIGYAAEYAGLDRALLIPAAVCVLMTAGALRLRRHLRPPPPSGRTDGGEQA